MNEEAPLAAYGGLPVYLGNPANCDACRQSKAMEYRTRFWLCQPHMERFKRLTLLAQMDIG